MRYVFSDHSSVTLILAHSTVLEAIFCKEHYKVDRLFKIGYAIAETINSRMLNALDRRAKVLE